MVTIAIPSIAPAYATGIQLAGSRTEKSLLLVMNGKRARTSLREAKRIDPAALAGDNHRVDDRGSVAGVGMAYEQPVLLAEGRRANGVLYAEDPTPSQ
jgi:hypothetical protein